MNNIATPSFPSIDTLAAGDWFECYGTHNGPCMVIEADIDDGATLHGLKHHVNVVDLHTGKVHSLDNLTNFVLRVYTHADLHVKRDW